MNQNIFREYDIAVSLKTTCQMRLYELSQMPSKHILCEMMRPELLSDSTRENPLPDFAEFCQRDCAGRVVM